MKYFWIYFAILIVFSGIVSAQFGDGMAKKESERTETERKRQEYLASRKASKLSSMASTTTEGHPATSNEPEK